MAIRVLALAVCLGSFVAEAAQPVSRRVERRVRIATAVVESVMTSPRAMPAVVLDQTRCLAALRSVKAGFIFGGEGSVGMVSCRTTDGGWSLPSFLNIGGPNVGLQIGVSRSEVLLAFVTDAAKQILLGPSVQLGIDAGFAVGPIGNGIGSGWTPEAPVLAYVQNQGLWIGLKLDALVLSHGRAGNEEAYGAGALPGTILETSAANHLGEVVGQFPATLQRFDR